MEGMLLGPYELHAEVGTGGMGKVFRAEVARDLAAFEKGSCVALKIIHPHLLETEGFFKRFLREAELGRQVRHPNVVRTYDCDAIVANGIQQHFLVMEYVAGQTLRDLLNGLEVVAEELCRQIGREIARGLGAIHTEGVIHRDLKPENVLITPDHDVKIMDLGVARLQEEAIRLSRTGHFVGSILYAAPEAFREGGSNLDGRADLYSVGVLLYELATGVHPYRHDDMRVVLERVLREAPRRAGEVNPQLSPFFEEVVHTLLRKDPDHRFQSADTLLQVLDEGEEGAWWHDRATAIRRDTRRPLRRMRIPRETALYGREAELEGMHDAYEHAERGQGRVVLIQGEAGIGKTRLVDEFVGVLEQEGKDVNFLFGSYPPGGAATSAGAFSTAYRQHLGDEKLEEVLADYLTPTPVLIPAFAALLRGEGSPKGEEALTKESLQTVFVHTTRALATERPTVVLIDDLHFAPEEGRALFAALAFAVQGQRTLLIGTFRPGLSESWMSSVARLDETETLELDRLGPKDLAALLRDALGSRRSVEQLGFKIGEKSDGNPYFAFEIIRSLREERFLRQQEDGTWITTDVLDDFQVPSSVLDLVQARIADLADEERDLLDVAACIGFEFDPGWLADAMQTDRISILKHLAQIERRHRLIHSAGRRFVFDHHQVQEAIYASLPEMLREEYHAALARALEAREGAEARAPDALDGPTCVELCEHYLKGGQGGNAIRFFDEALAHLEASSQHAAVLDLVEESLRVPGLLEGRQRLEALRRKAERLWAKGKRQPALEIREEVLAIARGLGDTLALARAHLELGSCERQVGPEDEAPQRLHAEAALALLESHDAPAESRLGPSDTELQERFEALRLLWECHEALGQRENHDRILELAYDLARHVEDEGRVAQARTLQAVTAWRRGQYDRAAPLAEEGLTAARRAGDREWEANALHSLGAIARQHGDFRRCVDHWRVALAIRREIGDRHGEARSLASVGTALPEIGEPEGALEAKEAALDIFRELGEWRGECAMLNNIGNSLVSEGRLDEAKLRFERGIKIAQTLESPLAAAHPTSNLGRICLSQGDMEGARHHQQRALELFRESGTESGLVDALILGGEWGRRSGDPAGARASLLEALELAAGEDATATRCRIETLLAVVQADLGCEQEATAGFERARGLAESVGTGRAQAGVLERMAEVAWSHGETERATSLLEQAIHLFVQEDTDEAELRLLRARLGWRYHEAGRASDAQAQCREAPAQPQIGHTLPTEEEIELQYILGTVLGAPEGTPHLERAQALLREYAATIPDPAYRAHYLGSVWPANEMPSGS